MASNNSHTAGQPLFTPVSHPYLKRLGHKNICNFLRAREQYLLRLDDARNSGSAVAPVSIKASINPDILIELIDFDEFPGVDSIDKLNDEILEEWLKSKDTVSLSAISSEDLLSAVKANVRINVLEPDPELRIKSLFIDYKCFLRSKKWEDLVKKNPKLAS